MQNFFTLAFNILKKIADSGLLTWLIKVLLFLVITYFILGYINYKLIAKNEQNIRSKRKVSFIFKFVDFIIGWFFLIIIALSINFALVYDFTNLILTYGFDFLFLLIAIFIGSILEKKNLDNITINLKKIRTFFDAIFLIEPEKFNEKLKRTLNISNELLEKGHELETLTDQLDRLRDNIPLESSLKNNGIFYNIGEDFLSNYQNLNTNTFNTGLFILRNLENLENRVTNEISRLIRFSRQNLQIGTGLSIVAIIFLFFSYNFSENILKNTSNIDLSKVKTEVNALEKYFIVYFPKISIVILIEIIAFFFLKLYRNSILDIKKLQSEKTDIDFKIISLKLAIISKNEQNITEIIKSSFSNTDSGNKNAVEDEIITSNQLSEIIKELLKKIK